MGLEISKRYSSYSFHLMSTIFMGILVTLVEYTAVTLSESMGKPNMWNITKMDDHRVKRTKIWDSESYSAHM